MPGNTVSDQDAAKFAFVARQYGCTHIMWQVLSFALRTLYLRTIPRKNGAQIAALQSQRLRRLIRYAWANSKYYAQKYQSIDLDRFVLTDLPHTNKAELMDHFDEVVTDPQLRRRDLENFMSRSDNLGRYYLGRYAVSHTSGSQGQPMLLVQEHWLMDLLFGLQISRGNTTTPVSVHEAVRRWMHPARIALVSMRPGFYPSASAFSYLPAGFKAFARVEWLSASDASLTERLRAYRPNVLIAYASILEDLALLAGSLRLSPELRQVVNNSEALTDAARQRVENAFGVRVLDNYATGECPFLSNGCTVGPGAHVNADWCILEVVDDAFQPVLPGTLGSRVLVTNLANRVQPIIRYEIGDRVLMSAEPCACGSRFPRIARIEGRATENFWVRDGAAYRSVIGPTFKNACDYVRGIREWQAVQRQRNEIEVRFEPLPGTTLDESRARHVLLQKLSQFGLPDGVDVSVKTVPHLAPDSRTGKFRRIISLGPPPPTGVRDRPKSESHP